MTLPNEYLPGQTVLLTRRTVNRQFLLRPDEEASRIVGYTTLLAAARHDVSLHVTMTMSNHPHTVLTDNHANRDRYMQDCHSLMARKINLLRNRRGSLFDACRPGNMELLDRDKQLEMILYTCLNPVTAGLVRRAEDWPGFKILPRHWGRVLRLRRPALCSEEMPELVVYKAMPPEWLLEEMGLEAARDHVCHMLAEAEDRIARERMEAGRCRVVGARNARKISPFHTPTTKAPMRRRNPRFAASDLEEWERAKQHYADYLARYREARLEWLAGNYAVVFPAGVVQLNRLAKIRCAPVNPSRPGLARPPTALSA